GAASVIDRGLDLANVRIDAPSQDDHLQHRHEQGKDHRHAVAPHVLNFLVEDCRKSLEWAFHDAVSISACRRRLNSTNASSSVGRSGRTSSISIPRFRSSCCNSSPVTESSTRAWMDRPKMVALFRTDISLALRSAVVMAGAEISKRCVPAGV